MPNGSGYTFCLITPPAPSPIPGEPLRIGPEGAPRSGGMLVGEASGPRLEHGQLDPPVALLPGQPGLDRVTLAERHGHELPDGAVTGLDAVEPRLERRCTR